MTTKDLSQWRSDPPDHPGWWVGFCWYCPFDDEPGQWLVTAFEFVLNDDVLVTTEGHLIEHFASDYEFWMPLTLPPEPPRED